ncbi:hypothetical protein H6F43_03765 [Leptolyngbya sp. FACHB-36]|uniref:hypothetical protein n=1 Tax=Leptolyngbya sp. FACHB-36 TaxID=2692808 RepID=UPI0016817179|nr:hypothetical protein [Leptolyngbya sp. FACHB-36]MBD2019299.1 hypothetical protein [Leptolyngbya sp. FACHB-36]
MPLKDFEFKGIGLGTKHDTAPVSVKVPPEIAAILQDKTKIPDRSSFIRAAIIEKLVRDGLLDGGTLVPQNDTSEA